MLDYFSYFIMLNYRATKNHQSNLRWCWDSGFLRTERFHKIFWAFTCVRRHTDHSFWRRRATWCYQIEKNLIIYIGNTLSQAINAF